MPAENRYEYEKKVTHKSPCDEANKITQSNRYRMGTYDANVYDCQCVVNSAYLMPTADLCFMYFNRSLYTHNVASPYMRLCNVRDCVCMRELDSTSAP